MTSFDFTMFVDKVMGVAEVTQSVKNFLEAVVRMREGCGECSTELKDEVEVIDNEESWQRIEDLHVMELLKKLGSRENPRTLVIYLHYANAC